MWYIILIAALIFVIGLLVGKILRDQFYDGHIVITHEGDKVTFLLELGLEPEELEARKDVRFNIVHVGGASYSQN